HRAVGTASLGSRCPVANSTALGSRAETRPSTVASATHASLAGAHSSRPASTTRPSTCPTDSLETRGSNSLNGATATAPPSHTQQLAASTTTLSTQAPGPQTPTWTKSATSPAEVSP